MEGPAFVEERRHGESSSGANPALTCRPASRSTSTLRTLATLGMSVKTPGSWWYLTVGGGEEEVSTPRRAFSVMQGAVRGSGDTRAR